MAIPDPTPGLVISYDYLWAREDSAARTEGRKTRPCVVVLHVRLENGLKMVTVAPCTHSIPTEGTPAIEIPTAVKESLHLDAKRSWVVLDEVNRFAWPGFDLRHVSGARGEFAYGVLPGKLYRKIVEGMYRA